MAQAWMLGSALLVHPVVKEGATTVRVHLPENDGDKVGHASMDLLRDCVKSRDCFFT